MRSFGPSAAIPDQARDVIRRVAADFHIPLDLIMGKCRWRDVVLARAEAARRLRLRGYSSPKIGAMLGKDHTTILFYLGNGKSRLKLRPDDPRLSVCKKERQEMKLTPAQRDELMRLAAEGGFATSKQYAKQVGVAPNYGLVLLARNGRKPKRQNDKWKRAIAAGPVLA